MSSTLEERSVSAVCCRPLLKGKMPNAISFPSCLVLFMGQILAYHQNTPQATQKGLAGHVLLSPVLEDEWSWQNNQIPRNQYNFTIKKIMMTEITGKNFPI
jgi:hypothetical protein